MSVQRKLVAGFAVVVLVFTGLAAYHLSVIRESARTSEELRSLGTRLEATSARYLRVLDRLEESASKYWVTRDSGYARSYAAARDSFAAMMTELDGSPLTGRERRPVRRLAAAWDSGAALPGRLPDQISGLEAEAASDSLRALQRRVGLLRERTRLVNRASRAAIRSRVDAAAEAEERAGTVSWIALVAGLLAAGVVSWWVVRTIVRGLGRLRSGTRAVADGDFGHRIRIESDDEFGELASAFNAMTARLGEVDRLKRDFLSQVSHDLKSPLASMRETDRLLLDEVPGELNGDQRRLLEMSLRSGDRLATMIDRLLDLSRMEADAVSYELESVDLGALAREVADEFRPRLRDSAVELSVEAAGPAGDRAGRAEGARAGPAGDGVGATGGPATGSTAGPTAEVDRGRTVQVLQNLLENALEHSPDGGLIRVRAESMDATPEGMPDWAAERRPAGNGTGPEPRWVLLSVADDGPGVAPEDRPKIFERFHQVDGRPEGSGGDGVGLGLTLCREIVEAHGGAIWVEESESGGSRFRVLLPRTPPAGAGTGPGDGTTAGTGTGGSA